MSAAHDREKRLRVRCESLHAATGNPVSLHKSDFDWLMKRGKIQTRNTKLEGVDHRHVFRDVPVVRRI